MSYCEYVITYLARILISSINNLPSFKIVSIFQIFKSWIYGTREMLKNKSVLR